MIVAVIVVLNRMLLTVTDVMTTCVAVMQLTLTLMMTIAQVVKTSVTIRNRAIQDYIRPDDHASPTLLKLINYS